MKKEGEIMSRVMNRINSITVPSYIRREIGLKDNWQESISTAKQKMTIKTALKFKEALRKLSKN